MPFDRCTERVSASDGQILGPTRKFAAIYLDDVLIHSNSVEEGIKNLKEGLALNSSKCKFLVNSVTYLGFEINNGTITPGELKTKAINEFKPPQNVHQIR